MNKHKKGAEFIDDEHQKAIDANVKTDEILEDMATALTRLSVGAKEIGVELDEHNEIIGEIDNEVVDGSSKIKSGLNKIKALLSDDNPCLKIKLAIVLAIFICIMLALIILD